MSRSEKSDHEKNQNNIILAAEHRQSGKTAKSSPVRSSRAGGSFNKSSSNKSGKDSTKKKNDGFLEKTYDLGSATCLQGQGQETGFLFWSLKFRQVDRSGFYFARFLVR